MWEVVQMFFKQLSECVCVCMCVRMCACLKGNPKSPAELLFATLLLLFRGFGCPRNDTYVAQRK